VKKVALALRRERCGFVPGRRGGGASLRRYAVSAEAVLQEVRSRRRRPWSLASAWRFGGGTVRIGTVLQVDGDGGLGAAAQWHGYGGLIEAWQAAGPDLG
jgi:hypothetical protein